MQATLEKRGNSRLKLCYPIEVRSAAFGEVGSARAVTLNLSARGAYFKTFSPDAFKAGQRVSVRVVVPHPLREGGREIRLDMRTNATVLRLDPIRGRDALGENGVPLVGVALQFARPLEFRCDWV